jgi:hypothetical protein
MYVARMTELLEIAVAAARELPPNRQDEMARVMLTIVAENDEVVELTEAEIASIAESRKQAALGNFATDEQVQALWAKYRL